MKKTFTAPLLLASLLTVSTGYASDWKPSFNDKPVSKESADAIEKALPTEAIVPTTAARRILIYSATAGFRHGSIPHGKMALQRMGETSGAYEATVSDDPDNFEAEILQ